MATISESILDCVAPRAADWQRRPAVESPSHLTNSTRTSVWHSRERLCHIELVFSRPTPWSDNWSMRRPCLLARYAAAVGVGLMLSLIAVSASAQDTVDRVFARGGELVRSRATRSTVLAAKGQH